MSAAERGRRRVKGMSGCAERKPAAQVRAEREAGLNTRAHSLVLFEARPDEGNYARPTSAKHLLLCDTHVHFHMSFSLLFQLITLLYQSVQISGPGVAALTSCVCGLCANCANLSISSILSRSGR